jgi:mRNA-degrading endonuclease RelE of RelBE toxin-antitoxin system
MQIIEGDEFKKEFKRLAKKYRTLENDFDLVKKVITNSPKGDGTKHWNILWQQDSTHIIKTRMLCRSLRGSDLRIIYLYNGEIIEIHFIEIYFKGDKETEDKQRINDIIKTITK